MPRVADAILSNTTAFAIGHNNPMLDLQNGGQMGFTPNYVQWVSNQQYVRRNLICLLIEAPLGFNYLPNPSTWVGTLRALVELHALRITGLNAHLTVEVAETPVGGGGNMQQDVTDVKRERSVPAFSWNEKYGMPVTMFHQGWITNLLMDPDTKFANVATLTPITGLAAPTDMLADMYTATMIFIEPDPTHTRVVKSWLVTNMFPLSTGDIVGSRDLASANEPLTVDITYAGIAQYGLGVDQFAQQLLTSISIAGANPYTESAFISAINADVAATTTGYQAEINQISAAQAGTTAALATGESATSSDVATATTSTTAVPTSSVSA
ncbi:hypothetical protein [Paraburkholderia sp. BCC1886]|uniref:hypothetical protein n=1 Tax=Paraburkholderia sp. BCC1886 TaxID=2562670 RepID=UPI0011824B4D|nr:hypothetical protein [Paraburkholderia sp. BCC1886]